MKKTTRKRDQKTLSLLDIRCKQLGIVPPMTQPLSDDVIVWRLPPLTTTPGGIIIPDDHQSPNVRGVVVAAGYVAMDALEREGIRLGHIVVFKRFAGWEHEQQMRVDSRTPEHRRHNMMLHIKVPDILTSDDLYWDVKNGETRFIKDPTTGKRVVEQKPTALELAELKRMTKLGRRRHKLEAMANQNSSPREAQTAARLLAKGS